MRKIAATCLLTVMLAPALYNAGVLAYWLANHAYIAAELCENRDKPQLHCDGKCYLKKKMAENPESQGASLPVLLKGLELADRPVNEPPLNCSTYLPERSVLNAVYQDLHDSLNAHRVFHPPCFA